MKMSKPIRYILLILIMALTFTACSDNKDKEEKSNKTPVEKPKDPEEPKVSEENEEPEDIKEEDTSKEDGEILKEFKIIAEKSPTADILIKFIDENIEKVSKEDADEMINLLDISLEANRETYAERLFELDKDNELINIHGDEVDFKPSSIEEIKDEKLRVEVDYIYNNMYKLTNIEGAFYPIVDYKAFKKYDEYINDEGKDYIDIRSIDSEDRTISDGGINISFDELLNRILKTEEFLEKYPNSNRKTEMVYEYDYKINAYLNGLSNTPIMDYETKELKDEVLKSYKSAIEKDNYFSSIVEEHLKNIEANDNIVDDDIIEKAYYLISKAVGKFKDE